MSFSFKNAFLSPAADVKADTFWDYSAVACLVEGAVVGFIDALGWIRGDAGPSKLDGILTWVQISAAFILTLTNLSIPRAPNAYRDGKLVDRRESVCFLSRYTF